MERERRSRDYWREQLSEYWDGGLTIQEYCELKDLPYENVRRWIGILKKEREGKSPASGELEFVEVPLAAGGARNGSDSGISLHAAGFEIQVTCDFDQATLLNVLTVLRTLACSVSAEQSSSTTAPRRSACANRLTALRERWKNIFSRSRNLVTLSYFSVAVAKW